MQWEVHSGGGVRGGRTGGPGRGAAVVSDAMKLKVRVVRYGCPGRERWYADIDDAEDRQPDDPYWYVAGCASQCEALSAACERLAEITELLADGRRLERVGAYLVAA